MPESGSVRVDPDQTRAPQPSGSDFYIVSQGGSLLQDGERRQVSTLAEGRTILKATADRALDFALDTTLYNTTCFDRVWLVELGPGAPDDGVTALKAMMAEDPKLSWGSFLVPHSWGGSAAALTAFSDTNAALVVNHEA